MISELRHNRRLQYLIAGVDSKKFNPSWYVNESIHEARKYAYTFLELRGGIDKRKQIRQYYTLFNLVLIAIALENRKEEEAIYYYSKWGYLDCCALLDELGLHHQDLDRAGWIRICGEEG